MPDFESLIITYGYPILFLGAMLEGEMFVLAAAFLAYRGYLDLPWVVVVALLGTFVGDQFFFLLGRRKGTAFLDRRPDWQPAAARVRDLRDHHAILLAIGFRFLYGLRSVTPFVMGASGFPVRRFVVLNSIGGLIWVMVVASVGFAFGQAFKALFDDLRDYELWITIALAVIGTVIWLHQLRVRRQRELED